VVEISFSRSVGTPMHSAANSSSRIAARPRPNLELAMYLEMAIAISDSSSISTNRYFT
jgi:hypothetical protein